jgi:propionyl-CoA carboxylase alpha chain/3-methylcrotonyl-CoA carboxylase alpha subunit/acetyl-CoA/propionyl-CoA carboxylase biotin carboxyl carrier protein
VRQEWPFEAVLIANRGEIALRVVRTVQRLGLRAIVVHHALDAGSPAVRRADLGIEITGSTPVAAYLDGAQIIAAALAAGAGAVHPGYGFLSENAGFARACRDAGLVFIGPTPEVIERMGDKISARALVERGGFPVAPSAIEDDDPASFNARAAAVGFPLLIKPAAGGGGKGMRIVRDPDLLAGEIERARSEGQRYFGDGRLYAEAFVENPRHIEVQVLGDMHGHVVHLHERECSVQRRFQKIVEETPSPALTPELRREICTAAAGIARAAGYTNAGTVEFIFGAGKFYFLEMNTRLQVEHPVTEEVLGIDLVEQQLRVAAGEPLAFTQDELRPHGHAIEFRIYAEDAAAGYLPTTGSILTLHEPQGAGIRVDSGVRASQDVTAAFDPMLAKLIVHAPTRDAAIALAQHALHDYVLLGFKTNIGFLRRLLAQPAFGAGKIDTGFLDAHPEVAAEPSMAPALLHKLLTVAALTSRPLRDAADAVPALHAAIGAWRN